jgi:hypothetical protein
MHIHEDYEQSKCLYSNSAIMNNGFLSDIQPVLPAASHLKGSGIRKEMKYANLNGQDLTSGR